MITIKDSYATIYDNMYFEKKSGLSSDISPFFPPPAPDDQKYATAGDNCKTGNQKWNPPVFPDSNILLIGYHQRAASAGCQCENTESGSARFINEQCVVLLIF